MATDDVDIEETYDEPQKANPFASLPKSTMNLDLCKKAFFTVRTEGTPYFDSLFWTTYDSTGFSIHFGKYKYNGDLSGMDYVRRNTVGGMVQSMDSSLAHKNLYGVFKILKGATGREVVAVFITRGDAINKDVFGDVADDFEWVPLKVDDLDGKKFVSDAFHTTSDTDVEQFFDNKVVEHHVMFV